MVSRREAPPRLSASARVEIAQRILDAIDVPSSEEALRRYGHSWDGGPGRYVETAVDEATGLPYRFNISVSRMGDEVVLGVGVWPLPEIKRRSRRFRFLSDVIEGYRNGPVVRVRSLTTDR